MQINAYITVNGSMPTRSMLPFVFEKAKVLDLCVFAAAKTYCSPSSSFTVSVKGPDSRLYKVEPGAELVDKDDMVVIIDPPANDSSSFVLAPGPPPRSSPFVSQATAASLDEENVVVASSSSTQGSLSSISAGMVTCGHPIIISHENFLNQVMSILAYDSIEGDPSTSAASDDATSHTLLVAVYFSKREEVIKAFEEMKPDKPVFINQIDVYQFFNTFARKAALLVLQNPRAYHHEAVTGAKFICKKSLVDLLIKAYPTYNCPGNAYLPAIRFLAAATGNPWFNVLAIVDETSSIASTSRKRNRLPRISKGPVNALTPATPRARQRKGAESLADEKLETVVVSLAQCTTPAEMKHLLAETADVRYSWIKKMEAANIPEIPGTFIKKFPLIANNASLLNEDYKFNMSLVRGLPAVDFGEAFKAMIPAIFKVAEEYKLVPDATPPPTTSDADAWIACNLLIRLVPKYCKKNTNCKPDRLFIEAWDSTSIPALHSSRREMEQIAPMIFVLTNYTTSKKSYLVAVDDVAIQVKGSFCDALQSLMEVHYIFDLVYAKEMKPFFTLLEKFGNVDPSYGTSVLSQFYLDLKMAEACLAAEESIAADEAVMDAFQANGAPENSAQDVKPKKEEIILVE